jgi:EpsI family protein
MPAEDESKPSEHVDRRKVLLGLLFAATAGATWARRPSETIDYLGPRKLDKLINHRIGPWDFVATSGLVVPTEDVLSDALYSQLLTRVYSDGSNPSVMLLIAQSAGQTGLLQVHRPEFCYPAGGYDLSPIVQRPIQENGRTFTVNQLTATMPGRTEHIMYWTRIGDAMPASWGQQRFTIAADNLKGRIPDGVLVRLSTIDPDSTAAFNRLAEFVRHLMVGMSSKDRRVLVSAA